MLDTIDTRPTAPTDILDGQHVGVGREALCVACKRTLRAGARVTLYAYSLASSALWDAPRVYCDACAPEEIETPTLGAREALVAGSLATRSAVAQQSHRLTFAAERAVACSAPGEGSGC